ncbi:low molecular weight phosphatase family protein [Marinimicrobium agarilyticum]|uniref:arsenate-mycothiol transferase ArsC n=1 Tax=Marinimicrobium agarilyticum TaxID=306546 RepID=UPI000688F5C6|nr:hypothetical protein [Marinimicrobium agarilyticum]
MLSRDLNLIKNHFGSRLGLLRYVKYRIFNFLGLYKEYKDIDFKNIKRLVFICSGNICRSPVAEAFANNIGVQTESYGLHCRGGDSADPRAILYAESIGLDLGAHVTRNISSYLPHKGDLLVGMEPYHAKELAGIAGKAIPVTLACLWTRPQSPYLHDPFNTNQKYFQKCENMVVQSTKSILDRMKN